jgi:Na+-driven multidrug efflux pump
MDVGMNRHPLVDAVVFGTLVGAAAVAVAAVGGTDGLTWQALAITLGIGVVAGLLAAFARRITTRDPISSRRA